MRHLDEGNFTALEKLLGGPKGFDEQIIGWHKSGKYNDEPEAFAEAFTCACMLGRLRTAEYLLDNNVDPFAGIKTGLNGFHYAASGGQLEIVKLLIERMVPMEDKNMYGGTVFDQAMWSAVNEWRPEHAAIVEKLIEAGSVVDDGYLDWWNEQEVPDTETKHRIAEILQLNYDQKKRIVSARRNVENAEASGNTRKVADTLKALGNLLRRLPNLRDEASKTFAHCASLYMELGEPLEAAWAKRHIGIIHEYAGRLENAEKCYDKALAIYREHSTSDDLNYANAVRYPAVVKERLGKNDEAAKLWEEAYERYSRVRPNGLSEGVAEAAAWLVVLAIGNGDLGLARRWFQKASEASAKSGDDDTHKFIDDVRVRLEEAENS